MRSEQDMSLEAVRRVGVALAAETSREGIVRVVLMEVQQAIGATVSLFVSSAENETIEVPAGSAASLLPMLHSHAAESSAIKLDDAAAGQGAAAKLRSYLQVPVDDGPGSQLGVFCFGHPEAGQFSDHSLELAKSLMPWVAAALARASRASSATPTAMGGGEWVARVSHDLRNPLQRICMVGEILSESVEGPQRELIAKLNRASGSMETLITDLVDVVALENKTMHLEPLPMNLCHSVLASCEASQELAKGASVELVCSGDENLPAMTMDTRRIEQALTNLLRQSIEAAPPGTQVRVDCKHEQQAICVEIHDQRKISESELASLTGRMYPGSNVAGQKADLGLNIARGIVEAHGGQVRAGIDPVGGMVWTLSWPLPERPAAED